MASRKSDGKTHLAALNPAPTSARPFARNLIVHRLFAMDANRNVISVEEKPTNPKSNYCITGLYFYDKIIKEARECNGGI